MLTKSNYRESSLFVKWAQKKMPSHPGVSYVKGVGALTRLHWKSLRSDNRNLNREMAKKLCKNKPGSGSCDEYPFSSTFQGCFAARTCEVTLIDLDHNRGAGTALAKFLRENRIVATDPYWVYVR
ncbi:NucA/NucB deoxyribonuclease domain-containing protein [Nocardioides sp. BYT-33-1]|uniref:NucA/NucB deoxyribonuclease domain-containing protein n=1 Tax=Nocardioides sp. BYT-33-1 TaxID=3416952 RepID=UPI003F5354C6